MRDIKYSDMECKGHDFDGHGIGYEISNIGTEIERDMSQRDIGNIKYRDMELKGHEFDGHGIG